MEDQKPEKYRSNVMSSQEAAKSTSINSSDTSARLQSSNSKLSKKRNAAKIVLLVSLSVALTIVGLFLTLPAMLRIALFGEVVKQKLILLALPSKYDIITARSIFSYSDMIYKNSQEYGELRDMSAAANYPDGSGQPLSYNPAKDSTYEICANFKGKGSYINGKGKQIQYLKGRNCFKFSTDYGDFYTKDVEINESAFITNIDGDYINGYGAKKVQGKDDGSVTAQVRQDTKYYIESGIEVPKSYLQVGYTVDFYWKHLPFTEIQKDQGSDVYVYKIVVRKGMFDPRYCKAVAENKLVSPNQYCPETYTNLTLYNIDALGKFVGGWDSSKEHRFRFDLSPATIIKENNGVKVALTNSLLGRRFSIKYVGSEISELNLL